MNDAIVPSRHLSSADLIRIARNAERLENAYRSQGIDALRRELQYLMLSSHGSAGETSPGSRSA